MLKRILLILRFGGLALWRLAGAEQELPPEEFLRQLRQPLAKDAWMEVTGRLTCVRDKQPKLTANLRVRVNFTPDSMFAQIVLNDTNVYGLEQMNATAGLASQHLDMPEEEVKPSLFDFGLTPADLTFAFIYWDFVKELPRQSSRWRDCRVLKLKAPDGSGTTVDVLFDAEHGFPMEASWYKAGETKPWRTLILKGAKRYENGLWFVKEVRLDGTGWKTQVKFDFAEKQAIGQ